MGKTGRDYNIIYRYVRTKPILALAPLVFGPSPQPSTKEDISAIYYRYNPPATQPPGKVHVSKYIVVHSYSDRSFI